MTGTFQRLMDRYGQTVTHTPGTSGEAVTLRAFLQPLLQRRQEPPAAATPLGAVSEKRWLYLGPASRAVAEGDQVDAEGLSLVVQEARAVYWRDQPFYYWALLRRRKEAAG